MTAEARQRAATWFATFASLQWDDARKIEWAADAATYSAGFVALDRDRRQT